MSMQDTARSRRLQEQQRKVLAQHGMWENAVVDDSIAKHIRNLRKKFRKRG